jgi:hypothetical protein
MRHAFRLAAVAPAIGLCLMMSACVGPPAPKTYPAIGKVVYKGGQPMTGGSVQFNSTRDSALSVVGEVKSDGTFKLQTVKDNARADGAPEGEYSVFVLPPTVSSPAGSAIQPKNVLPIPLEKKYKIEPRDNSIQIDVPVAPPKGP